MRRLRQAASVVGAIAFCGCSGRQSALDPAGRGAEQIAELTWWMTAGLVTIWCAVVALTVLAVRSHPETFTRRRAASLIIGGGVVVPTVVLAVLLFFGLSLLPAQLAPAPEGSQVIHVIGEQWWWRVRYERPGREAVELANEIHLPVGEPVEFRLDSADVIHAFWIPSLGGKIDMVPGRTN
ncbi:MAG: cytochrome B, partial [Planctomycetota bacterium]|nr:cytochrome B [Planctomycetota bacterium]